MQITAATTPAIFDEFERRDAWLGFGYLAGRGVMSAAARAKADRLVLDAAVEAGLTADELFAWANSKVGRWCADALVSGSERGAAEVRTHRLLPCRY